MSPEESAEFEGRLEKIVGAASDPQTGEIDSSGLEEIRETLRHCTLAEFEVGMLFLARMVKGERREADSVRIKAESRRLKHERRAQDLTACLTSMLPVTMTLEDETTVLSWKSSTRVEVVDLKRVPKSFQRVIPEKVEVNKLAARPLLLGGTEIPGLKLSTERKLEIK